MRCHPTDPDKMVVTSKNGHEQHTLAFTTMDGGQAWKVSRQSPFSNSIYIAGRVFHSHQVEVMRSRDNGSTWTSTVFDGGNGFGQRFISDSPLIMADGTLVLVGKSQNRMTDDGSGRYAGSRRDIFVFRSTNGGVIFSSPILVCDLDGVKDTRRVWSDGNIRGDCSCR